MSHEKITDDEIKQWMIKENEEIKKEKSEIDTRPVSVFEFTVNNAIDIPNTVGLIMFIMDKNGKIIRLHTSLTDKNKQDMIDITNTAGWRLVLTSSSTNNQSFNITNNPSLGPSGPSKKIRYEIMVDPVNNMIFSNGDSVTMSLYNTTNFSSVILWNFDNVNHRSVAKVRMEGEKRLPTGIHAPPFVNLDQSDLNRDKFVPHGSIYNIETNMRNLTDNLSIQRRLDMEQRRAAEDAHRDEHFGTTYKAPPGMMTPVKSADYDSFTEEQKKQHELLQNGQFWQKLDNGKWIILTPAGGSKKRTNYKFTRSKSRRRISSVRRNKTSTKRKTNVRRNRSRK
jgi:hypothetical protein